jgi:hypothetical protein
MADLKPNSNQYSLPVAFIPQASIFMQRIGHLRVLLQAAGKGKRRTAEDLATLLMKTLDQRIPADLLPHSNLWDWVSKRQQQERSGSPGSHGREMVRWQDAYLSDPTLPSFTGSLSSTRVAIDVVRWGLAAGVFSKEGTPSGIGSALSRLDSVAGMSGTRYKPNLNPYLLDQLALPWAHALLPADWQVVARLLPRLTSDADFDRTAAGDLLAPIFDEIRHELLSSRAPEDRRRAKSLEGTITALARQKGTQTRGVREHLVAVRLEPLVDLGILVKPDPYRWIYRRTESHGTEDYVPSRISTAQMADAMGAALAPASSWDQVWAALYAAQEVIRSPLGFAGFPEVAIVATYFAAVNGSLLELSTAYQLISWAQQTPEIGIRVNVDRFGKLRHVRLPEAIPEILLKKPTSFELSD